MKAIAGMSSKHMALLDEYRIALSLWSDIRALHSPEVSEVQQATKHLVSLEQELVVCYMSAEAPKQLPAQATEW